jgi:hypothetical protein
MILTSGPPPRAGQRTILGGTLNTPRSLIFVLALISFAAAFSTANDIYIAQNSAGANSGADCADAYAMSWFNSSSNWGSNSGQIGAGTTVHLCGTLTAAAGSSNYLTFQSSGSSSNPITLLFQSGAVITATYWSGGVININGNSNIVVDGGSNGIVQATANGTNQANQQDNGECVISQGANASNVTVQNLTCANLYIDSSPADNGGEDTYGIDIWNTSNLVIQNNTLHDMKWAIRNSYANGSTYSNLTVTGNNIYNMDHGWFATDSSSSGSAVMSNFYVYSNTLGSMTNWDNTANNNHHDGFHLNTNSSSTRFTNVYLYNNVYAGDPGANANAGFFSYPASAAAESGIYAFNNVFVNQSSNHCWANGPVGLATVGSSWVVNNTVLSNTTSCKDNGFIYEDGGTGVTFKNNILQNTPNAAVYVTSGTTISASNYNDDYQSVSWFYSGTWYSSLSGWQALGYDANSTTGNPQLTGTYHLTNSSSAAWQKGTSLYSMCNGQPTPGLGALCIDAAGVQRPSTGSWDMGAYEDSAGSSAPAPNPPTGLTAIVE